MKPQIGKKISPVFSVLAGKRGTKPAVWARLAVVAEAAAIGVGTAAAISVWPLSAAFFAASLVQTGISSGTNAAGSLGTHKHFAQITELSQKNLELDKKLLELLGEKKPQEQTNPDIQNDLKKKKLRTIFNLLEGKRGPKPGIWTGLAIAAEVAAIGVGITIAAGAWPVTLTLSAAFFAASLVTTGISSAINAATAVSNHKHFETITDLQQEILEKETRLVAVLEKQQAKPQAPAAKPPGAQRP